MTTSIPILSHLLDSVPRRSSASSPSCSIVRIPIACKTSFINGTCCLSSSAIGFLVPLYASNILWRKVGACTSNATVRYSGFSSSRILNIIFKNPYIAFVWSPSAFVRSGSPKNALFRILCPSINTILLIINCLSVSLITYFYLFYLFVQIYNISL